MKLRVAALAALLSALVLAGCHPPPPAAAAAPRAPKTPSGRIKHVIMLTVDGLMPESYVHPDAHGLAVPAMRAMVAGGAWSAGARPVYPTITYPAHTTMVTGREPGEHGIVANQVFDPFEKLHDAFRMYTSDIRVPTLWDAAGSAGLRTAIVNWPVTVGAHADVIIPEVWESVTPEDVKLERVLSTPGIFDRVEKRFPGFLERVGGEQKDPSFGDAIVTVILEEKPALLLAHIWDLDDHEHDDGPFSPAVNATIETADQQIARIIEACKQAGIWNDTALVVLSDHGFTTFTKRVRPEVKFPEASLITVKDGEMTDWRAYFLGTGGQGYVYLKNPKDTPAHDAALSIFREMAKDPAKTGIARIRLPEEIRAAGGDPAADFAVDAAEGWAFARGWRGDFIENSPKGHGHHGYDPSRPDMQTSLLIYGPPIAAGRIEGARLLDVAPTVAGWLGLSMPGMTGHPLPVRLTSSAGG